VKRKKVLDVFRRRGENARKLNQQQAPGIERDGREKGKLPKGKKYF